MKSNTLTISLILALVILVLALWETSNPLLTPVETLQHETSIPYAVLEDAHTRHFDEQGFLSYEFVAKNIQHFRIHLAQASGEDYTQLETPELTLHTTSNPWYATADHGKLTQDGKTLSLWPNVKIWQTNAQGEMIQLTTQQLNIQPDTKTLSTESPVVISSPQGKYQASGLYVDLTQQRFQLLNGVTGYHEAFHD